MQCSRCHQIVHVEMIRNVGTRLATSTTWANQRHLMAAHSSQLAPLSAAERPYGHPISRDRGGTSESWDSTIGTWHNSLQKMIQKNDSTSLFSFSKKSLTTKCFQMINWGSSTFFNFDPQAAKPRAAVTRVALSFTEMLLGLPGFSALSWNLATYIYIYIYRYIYIYTYLYILYIWIHVYIYIHIHIHSNHRYHIL